MEHYAVAISQNNHSNFRSWKKNQTRTMLVTSLVVTKVFGLYFVHATGISSDQINIIVYKMEFLSSINHTCISNSYLYTFTTALAIN